VSPQARKLVSLVALVGLILVGTKFFGVFTGGPVAVEIHYGLGEPPVADALEVAFVPAGGDAPVARFETKLVGPDVAEHTRLPSGPHRLEITLIGAGGARRTVERTIEVQRNAVIRIDLSREAI
jgi:hypothetical protein